LPCRNRHMACSAQRDDIFFDKKRQNANPPIAERLLSVN